MWAYSKEQQSNVGVDFQHCGNGFREIQKNHQEIQKNHQDNQTKQQEKPEKITEKSISPVKTVNIGNIANAWYWKP